MAAAPFAYLRDVQVSLQAVTAFQIGRCTLKRAPSNAHARQVDDARAADGQDWDVASVLTVVQKAARSWTPDRLQRFPDLRWALVGYGGGHWHFMDQAAFYEKPMGRGRCPTVPAAWSMFALGQSAQLERSPLVSGAVLCCRFTYEEEATPEDFFVPLVWSLAVADLLIPWRHSAIVLFAASSGPKSAEEQSDASGTPRAIEGSMENV